MTNNCNCNLKKYLKDDLEIEKNNNGINVKDSPPTIITKIVSELKPFRLIINKEYFFYGRLLINKKNIGRCKCSLFLSRNKLTETTDYLLQFYVKNITNFIKPFTNSGILTNRAYHSHYDGFYVHYDIISQTLVVETTNNNDISGLFHIENGYFDSEKQLYDIKPDDCGTCNNMASAYLDSCNQCLGCY